MSAKGGCASRGEGETDDSRLFCPFPSKLSIHAGVVQRQSVDWAVRMGLISSDSRRATLEQARIGYLIARAFSDGQRAGLQLAADWTTLFCIADDYAETLPDPDRVADYFLGLVDKFHSGGPANDEDPRARALLDLRSRMAEVASEDWLFEFAEHIRDVFMGFSWEAVTRAKRVCCGARAYSALRQITVGLYPQFHLSVLTDGIDMPRDCWEHPRIQRLMAAASHCVGWANDVYTYEKEMQAGETHNLVFVLMQAKGISLSAAVRQAIIMHNREVEEFVEMVARLDDFGEHEIEVRRFIAIVAAWIGGHLDWARETGRYQPTPSGEERRAGL